MMQYQVNIQQIRQLLELYYSGETTPAQERLLAEFFVVTPRTMLPDDLKADQAMFEAMSCLSPADEGSIMIPGHIEARIKLVADRLTQRQSILPKQSRNRIIMMLAGATVAAAMIGAIFMMPRNQLDNVRMINIPQPLIIACDKPADKQQPVLRDSVLSNSIGKPENTISKRHRLNRANAAPEPKLEEPAAEMPDVDESSMLGETVKALINSNISKAATSKANVIKQIQQIERPEPIGHPSWGDED